jgi:predicted permease
VGWLLGRQLPPKTPTYLGHVLFWVGIPLSTFVFLRQTDLSGSIWLAAIAAWAAILVGWLGMGVWLRRLAWPRRTQVSALLAAMVGNTGYLGFPVILTLTGPEGFAWALFYDLLGTMLGAYGLGSILASRGGAAQSPRLAGWWQGLHNPMLWSFVSALVYRDPLPGAIETGLSRCAWSTIALALVLIGMRLAQCSSQSMAGAWRPIALKMLLVPIGMYLFTRGLPIPSVAKSVLVLQAAMPPAFATVVLAETYQLDQRFAVATLSLGTIGFPLLLPLWLWLLAVMP